MMNEEASQRHFHLSVFFPYLVRVFYRDVSAAVQNIYASRYGLSMAEWRTMAVLISYEPLSAKEIVLRSSIDKVSVSRAVAGLGKKDLLERHVDPTDRRRVLLRLTRAGRNIMRDLVPLVLEAEDQMLSALTEEEKQMLLSLMEKVRASAAAMEPTAGAGEESGRI